MKTKNQQTVKMENCKLQMTNFDITKRCWSSSIPVKIPTYLQKLSVSVWQAARTYILGLIIKTTPAKELHQILKHARNNNSRIKPRLPSFSFLSVIKDFGFENTVNPALLIKWRRNCLLLVRCDQNKQFQNTSLQYTRCTGCKIKQKHTKPKLQDSSSMN